MKQDISNRTDIEVLINTFYGHVRKDETIGFIFDKIIGDDWSHHLPIMYQFWDTVLFQNPGYIGNPIKKHIDIDKDIPLTGDHFQRWIELWKYTVDELFMGKNAEDIKQRAALMKDLILQKIKR